METTATTRIHEELEAFKKTLMNSNALICFFLLASIVCLFFAFNSSYQYLVLGNAIAEPSDEARVSALFFAKFTIAATGFIFIMKTFFRNHWLTVAAVFIVVCDMSCMVSNQWLMFKNSALPEMKNEQKIAALQDQVKDDKENIKSIKLRGDQYKSLSKAKKFKLDFIGKFFEQNKKADNQHADTTNTRKKIIQLIDNRHVTFASELPAWAIFIKCFLRAGCIILMTSLCFDVIGRLLGFLFANIGEQIKEKERQRERESFNPEKNNFGQV